DKCEVLLTVVREDSTRETNTVLATGAAASKDPPTTKDDMVRVLALRADPIAQMHWANAAEGTKNRRELDARKSTSAPDGLGGSLADVSDPYGSLCDIYNDYVNFQPQNQLIAHEHGVPVVPYRPVHAEVTALAACCHELNPCNQTRKDIQRTREWLKTAWRNLKGTLHVIMVDFTRSGNRVDPKERDVAWLNQGEMERWVRCANSNHRSYPDVSAYAYGVMDKSDFETIGKGMEKGSGRDDGVVGQGEGGAGAANKNRHARTGKRKNSESVQSGRDEIALALVKASDGELKMESYKLLLQYGGSNSSAASGSDEGEGGGVSDHSDGESISTRTSVYACFGGTGGGGVSGAGRALVSGGGARERESRVRGNGTR
ncbi:hypothetical protein B484DRAFT_407277, partial [Ochromonadaceae sp. CCMP2298]